MGIRSSIQRARSLSNCIIWAFLLRRRLEGKGHRIYKMKRKSDWGNFQHHLVGIGRPGRSGQDDRVRVVSYKPTSPRKRLVPPPLFPGQVKWGDSLRLSTVDDNLSRNLPTFVNQTPGLVNPARE